MIITIFFSIYSFYYYKRNIEYYSQICKYRKIKDYTRWILCDKYIAKKYAELNGFNVAKTYQLVKYPYEIKFEELPESYVIKPVDLCESAGVYFVNNNINMKTGLKINKDEILRGLIRLRAKMGTEYYMHELMYDGKIPFNGYIVEELLLDKGEIPYDYKCYTFNGRIYFIAITFNRITINGDHYFDSVWVDRNWNIIRYPMIQTNYKYIQPDKPTNYEDIIYKVENMSRLLKRHCRIDIYNINNKVYLGEFTFFCGATIHTFICNFILGFIWLFNRDDYSSHDDKLFQLVPSFYNNIKN
uniref:TupA-like ATPgrasp n=1 Tax=Megaviridae environmental sample TaxID=1737588 RepID=A0A5J6VL97_9VIRU|nr:MAG: TupA-like ATPgrasp [Megaviridae environmental sample]